MFGARQNQTGPTVLLRSRAARLSRNPFRSPRRKSSAPRESTFRPRDGIHPDAPTRGYRARLVSACWLLLGLLGWSPFAFAQGPLDLVEDEPARQMAPLQPGLRPAQPERRPRGLIVKYKSRGESALRECAELITTRGESFQSHAADNADGLDRLRERFQLGRHRAIFRKADGSGLAPERRRLSARLAAARSSRRARTRQRPRPESLPDLSHVYRVPLGPGQDPEAAAAAMRADAHVEYAHPDYAQSLDQAARFDDPFLLSSGSWGQPYVDLWGLEQIGAPDAWATSLGEGVVVAVVDTGLDRSHPDIAANVWVNPGEDINGDGVAGPEDRNGVDDDQNGFVDDLTGFDFADSDDADQDGFFDAPEDSSDADPFDERGHGTHVAGTIAAVANNGQGIVGVAPGAKIMALKAFPAAGSATDSVLWRAVLYAAENGATVVNNSWSCSEPCPSNPLAEDVLAHVEALGAVVVTSAGNRTQDVVFRSPENTSRVITVGAVGYDERLASFSNRGWGVDVVAPGGEPSVSPGVRVARRNILSLLTSAVDPADEVFSVGSQYLRLAGTSMSSPHVAGAVALLQSLRPELTPADIRRLVRRSARDLGLPGHDPIYAAGLLDVPSLLSSELPDIDLEIDAPRSASRHDPARGPIAIRVRAGGQDFESLEIDVAPGLQGRDFRSLESFAGSRSRPSLAGETRTIEASWDATSVTDGPYVLRFRARLRDGTTLDEYVVLAIERLTPVELADGERTVAQPAISGTRVAWPMKPSADPLTPFELAIGRLRTTAVRPRKSNDANAPLVVETTSSPSDVSVDGSIVAWRIRDGAETRLEWCQLTERSSDRRTHHAPLLRRMPMKPDAEEEIGDQPRDCEVHSIDGLAGTLSRPWAKRGWIVWQRDEGRDRVIEGCRLIDRSGRKRSPDACIPMTLFAPSDGPRWALRSFDGRALLLQAVGQLAFCSLRMEKGADGCQLEPIRFAPGTPAINEPIHDGALLVFDDVTIESRPPLGCLADEQSPECVPNFAVVAQHRACWIDASSGLCDSIPISSAVRVERMAGVAVSGRHVVWSLADPLSEPSLRFCEFQKHARECVEQRLVSSLASQDSPSIDGHRVVWRGARGAAPSVWGYALPTLDGPGLITLDAGRPLSIPLRARRGTSRTLRYEIEGVGALEGELDAITRALRVVDPGWPGGRVFLRGAIPRRAAGIHSLRVRAVGEAGLYSESIIELKVDAAANDGARKSGSTLRALRRWLSDWATTHKPGR